jgi:alcohol dehydrogenase class IV
VDPELALGLPPRPTATTGLDALAQLVEPFVGLRRNPFTDALCRDGIPRAVRALPRAFARGCDGDARAEMAFAALLGGMVLANSGLGAVHGLAGPLGGMYGAPHGALCAALLAPVWRANAAATARGGGTAGRHREAARLLTGSQAATAEDGGRWLGDFVAGFDLGGLRSLGVPRSEFDTVAGKAAASSSMKGNPVALSREELVAILEEAW